MYQIYNQDCIEFMKTLPDNSVDMCLTDPPYKVITGGRNNGKNSNRPKGVLFENKELMKSIPEFNE